MNYDFYKYRRLSIPQPLSHHEGTLLLSLLDTHNEIPLAASCLSFFKSEAMQSYRQGPGKRASALRLLEAMSDDWLDGAEDLAQRLDASTTDEILFVLLDGPSTTYVAYTDPSLTVLHGITRRSDNDGGSTGFGVIAGNNAPPPAPLRSAARQWPPGSGDGQ